MHSFLQHALPQPLSPALGHGINRQQRTTPACTGAEETGPHRKVRAIFISARDQRKRSEVPHAAVDPQFGAHDIA